MWTDAVELGVTAFFACHNASDAEVIDWLERQGVEPWLAERLVGWLPVAFGRRLWRGAASLDVYADPDGTNRRLSDDPVYEAAALRAEVMSREEARVIATRSAEAQSIDAVMRNAEAGGREPPPLASVEVGLARTRRLPPIQPGDGGVPEPRAAFAALLQGHGHDVAPLPASPETGGPHTLQRVEDLTLDAFVYVRDHGTTYRPQVDFMVRHPSLAKGSLLESFAGLGSTYREAIDNAVRKFERGSLHVLIASLLDPSSCSDQVAWERWSEDWAACVGPQLLLYQKIDAAPMGALVDRLREAFLGEVRDRSVHAVRVFTMRSGARSFADEVLLDGEPWPAGEALCRAHAWPHHHDAVWGARLFLMVTPSS